MTECPAILTSELERINHENNAALENGAPYLIYLPVRVSMNATPVFDGSHIIMKMIYRDVEYVVQSTDGTEWTYNAYPKKAKVNGSPLHGTVTGTEVVAVKACKDAIDDAYGGKSN